MVPVILWFFLAVVQVEGLAGQASTTREECEAARQELSLNPDVLMISPECSPITVIPIVKDDPDNKVTS